MKRITTVVVACIFLVACGVEGDESEDQSHASELTVS